MENCYIKPDCDVNYRILTCVVCIQDLEGAT